MNTRYIVVLFYEGIGRTLQTDNNFRVFFERYAKVYKNLGSAINKANKTSNQYICDKVCVFKVTLDERLSCDQYKKWCEDEERLRYSIPIV